jgi:hypothetical protein
MSWPPYLLKIRIENKNHFFPLWIPLFIIGPVVLLLLIAIFLIILPFALLSVIFTLNLGLLRPFFFFFPAIFRLFTQLPGLKIDVGNGQGRVYIIFI